LRTWNIVVSILTRIWVGRSEIIIRAPARGFFFIRNPHSLVQRGRLKVLPQGVKRHGHEADNSPLSSGEVNEVLSYTSPLRVKEELELHISYTNNRKEGFSGK
jgi:hypothetical protein